MAGSSAFNTYSDRLHKREGQRGDPRKAEDEEVKQQEPLVLKAPAARKKKKSAAVKKGGKKAAVQQDAIDEFPEQEDDEAAIPDDEDSDDEETLDFGTKNLSTEDMMALTATAQPLPSAECIMDMRRGFSSDYSKLKQAAISQIGAVAREHIDLPAIQELMLNVLELLRSEPCNSPLARSIVKAISVMTIKPGGRNILKGFTTEILTVVAKGGRSIREKGCLVLMNLTADESCRQNLMVGGVVPFLLDSLKSAHEGEEYGAAYLQHAVGALCNISLNLGDTGKMEIYRRGGVKVLLSLVQTGNTNLTVQRCAALLEALAQHIPAAAAELRALADEAGMLDPVTPIGQRGRPRLHPVKVISNSVS